MTKSHSSTRLLVRDNQTSAADARSARSGRQSFAVAARLLPDDLVVGF
jgi:hypothetical protein